MRCFRIDIGSLGKAEPTPQGGVRVPAYLTKTGVFTYSGMDGSTIREWRPPEEVFKAATLLTLKGAPLTNDHPPERIQPDNYRQWSVGHVGDDVKQDEKRVGATIYIQDAEAIRALEAGRRELSCGYHCDVEETSGITPDGEPYDRIQRGIFYNHAALVDNGRAGHDVRLRLDSAGNSTIERERMDKIEVVDGIEYQVGTDAHKAAKQRLDATGKDLTKALQDLKAEHDKAQARADAAEAKLEQVVAGAKKMFTPERLDKAVNVRQSILTKAEAILGKSFKTDGLTNGEIKIAAVKKAYAGLTLEGKSRDYIDGLFQAATPAASERKDSAEKPAYKPIPEHLRQAPVEGTRSLAQVRSDAYAESEMRSSRPLAMSRRDRFKEMSSHPMLQGSMLENQK